MLRRWLLQKLTYLTVPSSQPVNLTPNILYPPHPKPAYQHQSGIFHLCLPCVSDIQRSELAHLEVVEWQGGEITWGSRTSSWSLSSSPPTWFHLLQPGLLEHKYSAKLSQLDLSSCWICFPLSPTQAFTTIFLSKFFHATLFFFTNSLCHPLILYSSCVSISTYHTNKKSNLLGCLLVLPDLVVVVDILVRSRSELGSYTRVSSSSAVSNFYESLKSAARFGFLVWLDNLHLNFLPSF